MKTLILAVLLLCAAPAWAGDVYKWVDENGVTHFTSSKPHPQAKPAELPEIMRGEFNVSKKFGATCDKHGGLNCSAGADSDGSVVCMDGFKGASARYSFQCSSPKLVISDISEIDESGEFKVFVRNSNSVAAKAARVEFAYGDDQIMSLKGPDSIEPYGVAEYTFSPTSEVQVPTKPTEVQLSVICGNCG